MLYPVELRPRWENVWKKLMFPAEFGHYYLGRAKGFEPSTTGITIQRSTNWATPAIQQMILLFEIQKSEDTNQIRVKYDILCHAGFANLIYILRIDLTGSLEFKSD